MPKPKPRLRLVGGEASKAGADKGAVSAANRAFIEKLYRDYRAELSSYVARLVPDDPHDVESILQETYIRLLRQYSLEHLQDNARAYIYTVATNLVRDHLRRYVRRRGEFHDRLDEQEHASKEASPLHSAQWAQSMEQLKQALLALKPLTRRVFLLSRFEQMSYPEVARTLAISTRSVERHMSTAMKHLQKTLDDFL